MKTRSVFFVVSVGFLCIERHNKFPLYPGCRLLGGVVASEDAVLKEVRTLFCNDRLFGGSGDVTALSSSAFVDSKFALLGQLSKLVGVNVRSEAEPGLLKALNTFCAVIAGQGKKCEVVRVLGVSIFVVLISQQGFAVFFRFDFHFPCW